MQQESSFDISEKQIEELDSMLEKYENGEMKFSPWDKLKERVRSRAEDAL